ncbi:MAG: NAD(P)-dependent oxidoreductase [Chloroflexi bacterium]|nr:NAD(P)-dependent oxidoreductase [Chloroflexota bacterium]
MRVLITGAAGFLGSHLARRLLALDYSVVAYDQAPVLLDSEGTCDATGDADSQAPTTPRAVFTAIQGSVTDQDGLAQALKTHRIDAIVHLATLLTDACAADMVAGVMVNGAGTGAVFEAAWRAGVRRVVFGSSVAALGQDVGPAPGDRVAFSPTSVYGATKAFGELLAGALRTQRPEQELIGLRFGWIYGPGRVRGWNALQRVIELFALESAEVPYPDYDRPNDWTYVDDAVAAIVLCLHSPRPSVLAYNVPGAYRRVQEAVAYLQQLSPASRPVPYQAQLPPDAWDFSLDHIAQETGYRPRFGLEVGLDRTVAAIRRVHGLPQIGS